MNDIRMDRRDFLGRTGMAMIGLAGAGVRSHAEPPTRPNILFILIDDLGWADIGCFGSTFYETPNIDRLAASGLRFTQAYAACPVCSPTRASIMTGKYPARLKLTNFLKGTRSPEDSPLETAPYIDELPLKEITVAEILKKSGYTTGHVGKWHLGKKGFWPEDQGFDFNYGGSDAGSPKSYFWPEWGEKPPIKGTREGEYLTDRLTEEACRFITNHKDSPFYLNLCHYSVHIPLQAKAEKLAKYEAKSASHPPAPGRQNNPCYAAMIESVDESVGRIMDTLDQLGLRENTIVFFFSDNGGLSVEEGSKTPSTTNAPLRDGKGFLHEGGIREPFIVSWPKGIAPGGVCETPVSSIDFLPTACALAETTPESAGAVNLDGMDISPLFRRPTESLSREALYWHYPHFSNQGGRPGGAIRSGDWKLIENYEYGDIELYNLREDIGEAHNCAEIEPERARTLLKMLHTWRIQVDATMPPQKEADRS